MREVTSQEEARHDALGALDAIPAAQRSPNFNQPWEAQAFAIALALHRRGVFTWAEWAATLGSEIQSAQARGDPDRGDAYYRHWLAAIERIVRQKGIADEQTLVRYRAAWDKASDRTPHGQPVQLSPADFA